MEDFSEQDSVLAQLSFAENDSRWIYQEEEQAGMI
jgi:hypothetical protein